MNSLGIYLLKSGLALWLFYGVYWLFLRKETFFSLNRFILLGSVVLSFILPFVSVENLFSLRSDSVIPSFFMDLGEKTINADSDSGNALDIRLLLGNVLMMIYVTGIAFLATRLMIQMITYKRLRNKYTASEKNGMALIFVNEDIIPFSFFRNIFVNSSMKFRAELDSIILHESAHIKNLHFLDLIFFGIAGIFQWFNPVMWLYERSIRELHEYDADREVLKLNPDRGNYQALLVNQVTGIEVFKLANSFSKSITKNRIIMMSKMKSGKLSALKVLFILPITLCLIFAFSSPQVIGDPTQGVQPKQVTGKVTDALTGQALSGAVVVIEGTTEGTVTGEDGNYKIVLPGGEHMLIYSFVGYETQRIKADRAEINVKMQTKVYDLPDDPAHKPGEEITPDKGEDTFVVVEAMPTFEGKNGEGFQEYLAQNVVYPAEALKNKITGKVYVQCTVNKKGEVVDVKVVRSSNNSLLDQEAVRVVESSPLWKPGSQKGEPVDVQLTFPINFTLN